MVSDAPFSEKNNDTFPFEVDNHLYIVDAGNSDIVAPYSTGRPIWDKVAKGDTLWGSPVHIEIK